MTQALNPFSGRQFLDSNGNPYVGAKLFVYLTGTSTKATVTKDKDGLSNHANPIILNARGEPADGAGTSQLIWQTPGQTLKMVLAPSTDSDPPVSPISTWEDADGASKTSAFMHTVLDDTTSNAALTTLTATRSETGAVAVPVLNKLRARVSPEDFGAVGDGTTDDLDAWNNAIAALDSAGGGDLFCDSSIYALRGGLNSIDFSNISIIGDNTRIKLLSGSSNENIFPIGGTGGASTTISVDATAGDLSIQVTDATNFSTDSWILISRTTAVGTYTHTLVTRIKGKAGSLLTLADPIPDEMLASDSPSVTILNMIENLHISGFVFDGLLNTGTSRAIYNYICVNSSFINLKFENFKQAASFYANQGYGNKFESLRAANCGSASESDITIRAQTAFNGGNIVSHEASGFGPQVMLSTYGNLNGIITTKDAGRGVKFQGVAWSNFKNIVSNNSASTGIAITVRTIRCTFDGAIALSNRGGSGGNDVGLWFSDQDNDYNRVTNLVSLNNQTADLYVGTSDENNVIEGQWGTESINATISAGNLIRRLTSGVHEDVRRIRPSFSAHKNGTDQTTISSATWTKLTFTTEDWDEGSHYDAANSKFIPTVPGKYRLSAAVAVSAGLVDGQQTYLAIYKNGSVHRNTTLVPGAAATHSGLLTVIVDANGSSDYFEVYINVSGAGDKTVSGGTNNSYFQGERI